VKVLIAGHTPMGGDLMVGSHHLARTFAEAGHDVLHLVTPVTPFHALLIGQASVRHRLAAALGRTRTAHEGVRQVAPVSLVPGTLARFVPGARDPVMATTLPPLRRRLRTLGFHEVDLLLLDDPWLHGLLGLVEARTLIYRPTDLYRLLTGSRAADLERLVLGVVDGVVATSEPVREDVLTRAGRALPATVVENGVPTEHMSAPRAVPAEYPRLPRPRVVYTGALDERFDWAAVLGAAERLARVRFILIGPITRKPARPAPANVHLLGPRPYEVLPAYLQHADAGMLPLGEHPSNRGRSPVKLYEYLAASLPVAARATPELERRATAHVHLYRSGEELADTLERILTAPRDPEACRAAATGHDWKDVARRILDFAAGLASSKTARPIAEGGPRARRD